MITEAQIQAVVQHIVEGYAPYKLCLFGAYAYGTPHEDSDPDLRFIKEKAEPRRSGRAVAVRLLLWGTGAPALDILIRTPAEVKRATGIFQSAETSAEQQGRLLHAAWYAHPRAEARQQLRPLAQAFLS